MFPFSLPDIVFGTGGTETQAGSLLACGPLKGDFVELASHVVGYCLDAPSTMPAGSARVTIAGHAQTTFTTR